MSQPSARQIDSDEASEPAPYALASVYPRHIAWLVQPGEWKRFEAIVRHNCTIQGGYFNVVIPLSTEGRILPSYLPFLRNYDADLIILPPCDVGRLDLQSMRLLPYGQIPWDSIDDIIPISPGAYSSGQNASIEPWPIQRDHLPDKRPLVAVADPAHPDLSKLAYVACGDVGPHPPMINVYDGVKELDAFGYRETFLSTAIRQDCREGSITARFSGSSDVVPAPDRYALKEMIRDECQFPLTDPVRILEACCQAQHRPFFRRTFIGETIAYARRGGTPHRTTGTTRRDIPALVILTSEHFDMQEAVLFWNLRANLINVAWLPFSLLARRTNDIVTWLESDLGGSYFTAMVGSGNVAFCTTATDQSANLDAVVHEITASQKSTFIIPSQYTVESLIGYNAVRPCIVTEHVPVSHDRLRRDVSIRLPTPPSPGYYSLKVECRGLVIPSVRSVVNEYVSSEKVMTGRGATYLPRARADRDGNAMLQVSEGGVVRLGVPSGEEVFKTIVHSAGLSGVEISSAGRYHSDFVNRCGDLSRAVALLSRAPYRQLLELLSDNSDTVKSGWVLDHPSKRRALHHLDLRAALGLATPDRCEEYFRSVSDHLSSEVLELLEKGIIERGFLLRCKRCSFASWYPIRLVTDRYECARCMESQVYGSNPLWLYKLSEVVFQAMVSGMATSILACGWMKGRSKRAFSWYPDSDVYLSDDRNRYRNTDILCISDGRIFIGEAKTGQDIERDQFDFYGDLCTKLLLDGVIFATSAKRWSRATIGRINQLRASTSADVIVLTGEDLYGV